MTTVSPAAEEGSTLRGAAMMVVAMACFAVEDALIKKLGGRFPAAQIIWMLGLGGAVALGVLMLRSEGRLWSPAMALPGAWLRTGFEVAGTLCFVSALVLIPLATASAVVQATPLVVAAGAALFLGARVGWRRWAAILIGFGGVLLILRPGSDSFNPGTVLAVAGICGLAARDLATRRLPRTMSGIRLSWMAFAALTPAGMILQALQGAAPVGPAFADLAVLAACVGIAIAGYLAIVSATRQGDLAVVSSYRYSRMLFALILAQVMFGERPDGATLIGVAIIIAAGLYTLIREARLARGGDAASDAR